jgi:hypothetical protein
MREPASVARAMGGDTRTGITHKMEIYDRTHNAMIEGYITGNLSADGELKEVFLRGFGKEGSTFEGWAAFASIAISLGLQGGMQFKEFAQRIAQMKFEPYGDTDNPTIPWVPSVPAYIVAWLTLKFGDDEAKSVMNHIIESEWGRVA